MPRARANAARSRTCFLVRTWNVRTLARSLASVVIVTAHAAVEVLDRARAHGAAECLGKLGFLPRVPRLIERYAPRPPLDARAN